MAADSLDCDVAVIGAGPAGAAAACILALAGLDAVLLGPALGDELKAGESMPGAAIRLLRRLGVDGVQALLAPDDYLRCSANASAWGTDHWDYRDAILDPEGGGWHLLRHRFDAALLGHALAQGVRHLPVVAERLEGAGQGYRISGTGPDRETTIQARWLIDATGRRAWVARRLAGRAVRHSAQLAAVAWLHGLDGDRDDTTRIKSVADGWWYTARLPRGLRVLAFHGLAERIGELVRHPQRLVAACNATDLLPVPLRAEQLAQGPRAHDASVRHSPEVAGSGWIAVGDAALSFDPLSSQGIFFALYSGIRGAEAVAAALHSDRAVRTVSADYRARVGRVYVANDRARRLFFVREPRYRDHPYWRTQQGLGALAC